MTKKNYIILAGGIKKALLNCKQAERMGIIFLADIIAIELQKENPKFNPKKFWDYISKK